MVFPWLNQKMDFGKEVEAHMHIHHALDAFSEHIAAARSDTAKFEPATLVKILNDLRAPLVRRHAPPCFDYSKNVTGSMST